MGTIAYEKQHTAVLVIDPYNDFISEGGEIWPRIKTVAEANNCVAHMQQVLNAARQANLHVFYAMHRRDRPGDYETWRYIAPIQKAAWRNKSFEYGTWGGEIRAEFAPPAWRDRSRGTLVFQRLRQHRFRFAAQEAWHPSAHRHRTDRAHLHRSDRSLCCRARLRRHGGERRDSGLLGRDDARRARHQHTELRQRDWHRGRTCYRDCRDVSCEAGSSGIGTFPPTGRGFGHRAAIVHARAAPRGFYFVEVPSARAGRATSLLRDASWHSPFGDRERSPSQMTPSRIKSPLSRSIALLTAVARWRAPGWRYLSSTGFVMTAEDAIGRSKRITPPIRDPLPGSNLLMSFD